MVEMIYLFEWIQTCGKSIDFSLEALFKTTNISRRMEKSNVVQAQKKLRDYDQRNIDLIYRLQNFTDCRLLSITHEIYKNFDYSPMRDITEIFLNISNAFVKI